MKMYGGDQRYWFYNLIATSDGGCIMTGMVGDYDGADNTNGYLIKVMPEDIVTNAEETPLPFDYDVAVFPNPFTDHLYFETVRKNLRLSLTDNTGKEVANEKLTEITRAGLDTGHLLPGIYYYKINDKGREIQTGKLIKQ